MLVLPQTPRQHGRHFETDITRGEGRFMSRMEAHKGLPAKSKFSGWFYESARARAHNLCRYLLMYKSSLHERENLRPTVKCLRKKVTRVRTLSSSELKILKIESFPTTVTTVRHEFMIKPITSRSGIASGNDDDAKLEGSLVNSIHFAKVGGRVFPAVCKRIRQ